ncbi:hypothetical protein N0V82_002538 [Gnomoniopsis sp. IMI 355080]|nr:hypothetical protein N0V82_002538 [Gnomoniopsis sp. IMI 355080]
MTLMTISILSIALSVPSIGLRWWARCTSLGFGRHVWNVNPANAIPLLQIYWVSQQLYAVVQLTIQISILALYARVFPTRWFRIAVWTGITSFIVQDVIYIGMIIFRCSPMNAIWDVRVTGRCLDLNRIGFSGAILHIVEHFILLVLPLYELWKLNLSRRKKIQLCLVFTLGSFSCVTSVIRLKYVAIFDPTADASWDTVPVVVWSVIEDLSAVICINLPPCRHLIQKLFPRQFLTSKGDTRTTQNRTGEIKHANMFDVYTSTGDWRSLTTVVGGARAESIKGYATESMSWLDSPAPSPSPQPRNFSRKAESVRLVKDESIGLKPLESVSRRPHSAHTLDVEIDVSELGMKELLQRRQTWMQESKRHTMPPKTG